MPAMFNLAKSDESGCLVWYLGAGASAQCGAKKMVPLQNSKRFVESRSEYLDADLKGM